MAAKPPWWKWIERNERRGAKALAAAGVLAASGHNPYSRRDQGWLDGLLHNPDSQVRWRYPDQRIVSAVTDGDLHDLSAAWDRAVGERKVDHGVRLVIDVDALTAPGTGVSLSEIPDVAQALVGPSMEVPASGKQTDVGAVSFACSVAYQAHEWQWPMRFAVDSGVSALLKQRLGAIRPLRRQHAVLMPDPDSGADIVVRAGDVGLAASPKAALGLEVVLAAAAEPLADQVAAAMGVAHPVALMRMMPAAARAADFAGELIDQFSHNLPMDLATFAAVRAVAMRRSGLILRPPLIIIPGGGNEAVLDDSLLMLQVNRAIDQWALLPPGWYIGRPPASAAYLGISPSSTTAGAYLADLRRAVREGGISFLRERHAGTGLVELGARFERAHLYNVVQGARSISTIEDLQGSEFVLDRSAPAAAAEPDRFSDLTLYEDYQFLETVIPGDKKVLDTTPLVAGRRYTLEVAIRLKRTGLSSDTAAPPVERVRETREPLQILAVAASTVDVISIANPVDSLEWPYDQDSTSALFRFDVGESIPEEFTRGAIEVRLYHKTTLDLLDIVKARLSIVDEEGSTTQPHKLTWPARPAWQLRSDPDRTFRKLSIHVRPLGNGYRCDFLLHRGKKAEIKLYPNRRILAGELETLLNRLRDFWTSLAITNYATKLSVTSATYKGYLAELAKLGQDAWGVLFGTRTGGQRGASEEVGEILATLPFESGTVVQVSFDDELIDFVFPWTVLYPPQVDEKAAIDPMRFWGAHYQIEQVREGATLETLSDEPVSVAYSVDSRFDESAAQATMFEVFSRDAAGRLELNGPLGHRDKLFEALLATPASHLFYFFCHGYAPAGPASLGRDEIELLRKQLEALPASSPDRQTWEKYLALVPKKSSEPWLFIGGEVTDSELKRKAFFSRRQPLVFLNMCHSAALQPATSNGLVRTFLDHDAVAVIGTESPMTSVFANAFAERVLGDLFGGVAIGTALWQARRHFLSEEQRNPLGLAYTLYGRATATLGQRALIEQAARQPSEH